MLSQVLQSGCGQGDDLALTALTVTLDETAVVGVLPDGQPWARRSPRLHHLGIGTRRDTHPLEQVQDQGVDNISHSSRGFYPDPAGSGRFEVAHGGPADAACE